MRKLLLLMLCAISLNNQAQKTYYVGHSLVNLNMPFMTNLMALDKNLTTATYRHHINIGTSLKGNWIDTGFNSNLIWTPAIGNDIEYGTNHLSELTNSYQNIVVTEAVPLIENVLDTSIKYAFNFFSLAQNNNPNIKKFIYATWEHPDASWASWRDTLDRLIPRWEVIADGVENRLGAGERVFIVPANIAMARLYDTLQVHSIGTLSNFDDLFVGSNNIHLNYKGNYFIACVMLATVYLQNPLGLGELQAGPYTSTIEVSDPILRLKMQQIAWETVCSYTRSGASCSPTSVLPESVMEKPSVIYRDGKLKIGGVNKFEQVSVFDLMGKLVYQSNNVENQVTLPTQQILLFAIKCKGQIIVKKLVF
jgi:hypothetical protein